MRGFYHDDGMIKVITGVRRCGKSCLMQSIAGELVESGVASDHIIYIEPRLTGEQEGQDEPMSSKI